MLVLERSMTVFIVRCSDPTQDKVFYFEADAQKYIRNIADDRLYTPPPYIVKSEMLRYVDEPDVTR